MKLKAAIATGVVLALALTGCDSTDSNNTEGAALTIAKPDGAIPTESNNPWIGDSSALKFGYANEIFEPLAFVNLIDPSADVIPWLASTIEWAPDYTSVTLTARDGVKWNDGEDFTADDIAFTFNLLKDTPAIEPNSLGIGDVAVSGNTVTVTFANSVFVNQDKVLHEFIVPEHIWKDVADVTKETNPNPVGTGPYKLTSFSSQSVRLDQRDDYWGGKLRSRAVLRLLQRQHLAHHRPGQRRRRLGAGVHPQRQRRLPGEGHGQQQVPGRQPAWASTGCGSTSPPSRSTTRRCGRP